MKTQDDSDGENAYAAPTSSPVRAEKKNGFPIAALAVVAVPIVILITVLLPAVQQVRSTPHSTVCLNNCRQIALALINYEAANGHFPPAYIADENGKPMHSWRVLLLPYLEEKDLYDRYSMDEPWDGPNNSKLHAELASPSYRCGSSKSDQHYPNYVLITGRGTMFDSDQTISYADLADGSSNTLLVTEIADAGFHWMKPQDITVDQFLSGTREGTVTNHLGEIQISLCDGSTHSIAPGAPQEKLRRLALIADGEEVDVEELK